MALTFEPTDGVQRYVII